MVLTNEKSIWFENLGLGHFLDTLGTFSTPNLEESRIKVEIETIEVYINIKVYLQNFKANRGKV